MRRIKTVKRAGCMVMTLTLFFNILSGAAISAHAENGHAHDEDCYAVAGDLLCMLPESTGHTHTEDCICQGGENICGIEEGEGHRHDESCYEYVSDEAEPATPSNAPQKELVCSLDEAKAHEHTKDCICPGGEPICGEKENEGHTHINECYAKGGELICEYEKANSGEKGEGVNGRTMLLSLPDAERTVSTVEELKSALSEEISRIGIKGQITLSEEIAIEHDTTFIGIEENAGFTRESGYTQRLLNISGAEGTNINIAFQNITVDGGSVNSIDSAVYVQDANLSIEDTVFKNCIMRTRDGATWRDPGEVVNGAGLYVKNSTVNITNSTFNENGITSGGYGEDCYGGAIYMSGCEAEISGCEFARNTLSGRRCEGGIAVYAENGKYTFSDTTFSENTSDDHSYAALFVCEGDTDGSVELSVDGCVFSSNTTNGCGGAISTPYDGDSSNNNRYINITNSEFTGNLCSEAGAFLLCGSHVKISDIKVKGNAGEDQGGGAVFYTSAVEITDSEFSDNISEHGCSGAIHVWDSVVEMTNVDIINNTAKYEGGGMCIYAPDYSKVPDSDGNYGTIETRVTFNGGSISFNKTTGPRSETDGSSGYSYGSNGGGVFVHTGGEFILNEGTMEGNASCARGGAVFVDDDDFIDTDQTYGTKHYYDKAGRFYMNGGMIRDNYAEVSGGGVYVEDASGASYVELSHRDSAQFVMNGGTIRNNTAAENGGGVFVQYRETPCVFTMSDEALIYDNKANNDPSYAGDDIFDETDSAHKTVNAIYPAREYSDILAENCLVEPLNGYAIPDNLSIPFINWYIDEAKDSSGNKHRFVNLQSPVPESVKLDSTNGLKAIWGGYLLLYDANDGSGRVQYNESVFYPGEMATVRDNMFSTNDGNFTGWNTDADGSGVSYGKDDILPMTGNLILYAQYQKTPTPPSPTPSPDTATGGSGGSSSSGTGGSSGGSSSSGSGGGSSGSSGGSSSGSSGGSSSSSSSSASGGSSDGGSSSVNGSNIGGSPGVVNQQTQASENLTQEIEVNAAATAAETTDINGTRPHRTDYTNPQTEDLSSMSDSVFLMILLGAALTILCFMKRYFYEEK